MNYLEITFSGRMRRKTYWWSALYFNIAFIVLLLLLLLIGYLTAAWVAILIGVAAYIWAMILGLSYTVRRLHDIGKSGSYIFIGLIPVVGGILLLIATLTDSAPGTNQYGPNPKGIN